jgi:hypothetical protein
MEVFAGYYAVLSALNEGVQSQLSDFEAVNATLKRYYLQQEGEIVIGGIPIILEFRFMCLFISLGRIRLEGSILINLFNPMGHHTDLQNLQVPM